eukprot:12716283-Prorocentrum_lima.AAC.1
MSMGAALQTLQSKRIPAKFKPLVQSFVCGGTWTRRRQLQCGYEIDNALCVLCKEKEDTLWHRLAECSHAKVRAA